MYFGLPLHSVYSIYVYLVVVVVVSSRSNILLKSHYSGCSFPCSMAVLINISSIFVFCYCKICRSVITSSLIFKVGETVISLVSGNNNYISLSRKSINILAEEQCPRNFSFLLLRKGNCVYVYSVY